MGLEEGNTGKSSEDFISSTAFRKCINQIRGIYVSPAVLSGSALVKNWLKRSHLILLHLNTFPTIINGWFLYCYFPVLFA